MLMRRNVKVAMSLVCALLLLTTPWARAQIDTATVAGRVVDRTGRRGMPGARHTRINTSLLPSSKILYNIRILWSHELDIQHDIPHTRLPINREIGLLRRRSKRNVRHVLHPHPHLPSRQPPKPAQRALGFSPDGGLLAGR